MPIVGTPKHKKTGNYQFLIMKLAVSCFGTDAVLSFSFSQFRGLSLEIGNQFFVAITLYTFDGFLVNQRGYLL